MKKWTALLLSIILAASACLTGCGDNNAVSSEDAAASGVESVIEDAESEIEETEESEEGVLEESSEVEISEETSSEAASSEETSSAVSSKEESSKVTSSKKESSKESSSKEESSKETSSKEVSSAVSSAEEVSSEETSSAVEEEASASCMSLLETAIDGAELPGMMFYEPSMGDAMISELTEYFYTGLDVSGLEDFCVGVPMMMVHASEVAIFKPTDAAAAKSVKAAIDARVESLNNVWSTYLPDQYALVEDHRVVEAGDYIIFVVAADAARIVKQFKAAL